MCPSCWLICSGWSLNATLWITKRMKMLTMDEQSRIETSNWPSLFFFPSSRLSVDNPCIVWRIINLHTANVCGVQLFCNYYQTEIFIFNYFCLLQFHFDLLCNARFASISTFRTSLVRPKLSSNGFRSVAFIRTDSIIVKWVTCALCHIERSSRAPEQITLSISPHF